MEGPLEKPGDGFLLEGDGADDERGLEFENLVNGFEAPAVAELRKMADGSDVGAPPGDADERVLCADAAENRGRAGSQRNDTQSLVLRPCLHSGKSITERPFSDPGRHALTGCGEYVGLRFLVLGGSSCGFTRSL